MPHPYENYRRLLKITLERELDFWVMGDRQEDAWELVKRLNAIAVRTAMENKPAA